MKENEMNNNLWNLLIDINRKYLSSIWIMEIIREEKWNI